MIEVDLSSFFPPAMGDYTTIISAILPDVVESTRTRIVAMAQAELGLSAEDYVQGVQEPVYYYPSGKLPTGQVTVASITLVGQIPNMIENGWAGGDMKPALLAGPNARDTADGGRVNVVPFRHATPTSKGRAAPKMGSAYADTKGEEYAARLGMTIHNVAKSLAATTTTPEGATQWGGRLREGVGGVGLLRPHHKTDIYAGMVRETKVYKKAKQSSYTSFRAVSTKSDPVAWIHPGIPPHHFFDRGAKEIDGIMERMLGAAMRGSTR